MTWKNETTRQPLPAPLPMYEPIRLKHVPTFVRRRYDRDLKKIDDVNEVLSSEEGKSDGDGVKDNDDLTIISDVGDSVDENEVEDFGSCNMVSSSTTYDGDSKIKNDNDQDAIDTSSYVDSNGEDNTQDQSWQSNANSDMNDHHGSYSKDCEDEDDGAKDVDFVSLVDVSIENDVHDNEQGSNLIEQKDEFDGPEDATAVDYVNASAKNEVQNNEQGVYVGFDEKYNKIDDDGAKSGIVTSWYDNGSIQDEVQDDGEHGKFDKERQGLLEEDDKSEGDTAEDVIHDAAGPNLDDSVDYEAEDDEQANNFDTKHDTNEDNSVDNGAQHKEQGVYVGFHEQDNNINDEGTNDGIVASCYENGSDQDKVEDDEHGFFDKEQGFLEEDDKSEGNRAEDVIHFAAGPNLDDAQTKFDTKHDSKSYTTTEYSDTNNLKETKFEGEIQQRDSASSVEASVEDSIKDHGHENSDIKHQDSCSKDFEEEEDGANNDVSIDTSVNNGDHSDQHNEKGLHMEDCATEDSGSMNAHLIESKDNEHRNFDDKQDLLVSDCEKIEDGTVANNFVDESFKLKETIEKQHEDLDIKQGIYQAQSSSFAPTAWLARRLIQVQWDPSPMNFHKLNFLNGLSTSSPKVGIIIRDIHGAILSAQVYKMGAISPVVAEAWALRNGLLQANKLDRSNLCTEGDNGLHIRMISRDYQCPWNLQFLVEDSKHLH